MATFCRDVKAFKASEVKSGRGYNQRKLKIIVLTPFTYAGFPRQARAARDTRLSRS